MTSINKEELRERVDAAMEGGERERIKQALRSKLVQSGWRDEIKSFVGELIETRGVDNVTAEELIEEVTPYASEHVSEEVKNALLSMIREAMTNSLA
jgi:enhancer of yellow 2 transcription factor